MNIILFFHITLVLRPDFYDNSQHIPRMPQGFAAVWPSAWCIISILNEQIVWPTEANQVHQSHGCLTLSMWRCDSQIPIFAGYFHLHGWFFPKQFTVGVLNATLDLAALVLGGGCWWCGVVGFLGSEVVLSPIVSRCLRLSPFMWGVGVGWCGRLLGLWSGLVSRRLRLSPFMWGVGVGWCGRLLWLWSGLVSRCLRLFPFMWGVGGGWCGRLLGLWSGLVSRCLRLFPFMWGVGVGWCGRLLGLWSGLVSRCLRLSPVVSLHVGGGGWLVWSASWLVWSASWPLKWSCLPLSPVVSLHVGGGCWLVWPHLEQKHAELKITGFNLNLLTVSCVGSTLV